MRKYFFILFTVLSATTLNAALTMRDGKLTVAERTSDVSLSTIYNQGAEAMECGEWRRGAQQFEIVCLNAPEAPIGQTSQYNLGVCYFELEEYELANIAFTSYLQFSTNPVYFQKAVEYKFHIAEAFRNGAKRRPFNACQFPRMLTANDYAVEIYDDVIAAIPSGELAACALYSKGWVLWEMRNYKSSIDSFQMLIKRFPKHELAPESYLMITHIYLDQCRTEFQNPDILAFAEIICRKFKVDFPGDQERIARAEYNVLFIREQYAHGLFTTAQFYERTRNNEAALIYYQKAMLQFPDTQVAQRCRAKLQVICPQFVEEFDQNQSPSEITFSAVGN